MHFDDPAFRQDALRGISETANRINQLVSRVGALRRLEPKLAEVDLNLLVADALEVFEGQPRISVVKKLQLQPKISVDRDQFGKEITNLLLNARDAIQSAGEVRVETNQSNDWAILSVADNGCGYFALLEGFPFPALSNHKEKGTRHRHVSVKDDCRSASRKDPGGSSGAGHNDPSDVTSQPPSSMKPKVLIVDDDEAIRTQMKWALSQDYEVHFAEDRKGALEVFKANSPAVTLLDLGLPPHPNQTDEGLAALSELLEVDATAKVIVISGAERKTERTSSGWRGRLRFFVQARGDR